MRQKPEKLFRSQWQCFNKQHKCQNTKKTELILLVCSISVPQYWSVCRQNPVLPYYALDFPTISSSLVAAVIPNQIQPYPPSTFSPSFLLSFFWTSTVLAKNSVPLTFADKVSFRRLIIPDWKRPDSFYTLFNLFTSTTVDELLTGSCQQLLLGSFLP